MNEYRIKKSIMKYIIRIAVVAIIMIASCATVFAQRKDAPRLSREELAEVQAKHIACELGFSDAATERFVKTFCDCQREIWALGPRPRPDTRELSEQENEERIKQRFARSEKILNIRQKYYEEYSKFLTQTQIEKVYEQERMMMDRLARRGPGAHKAKRGDMPIEK